MVTITLKNDIRRGKYLVARKGEVAEVRNIYPDRNHIGEDTRYFALVLTRNGGVSSAVRLERLGLTDAQIGQLWQDLTQRLS